MEDHKELKKKASLFCKRRLVSTTEAESWHPASCLSAADLTTVLFDQYFTYHIDNSFNLV